MAVTYKKLFHLLIDRGIQTTELTEKAGFSANIITRLKRDQYVSLDSIEKICLALDCKVDDILDFIIKTKNPAISRPKRSRCRSSQVIIDSPTPFSALNYEDFPRPSGADSLEGSPVFSNAPYRPHEYSRWQGLLGYSGIPDALRSTAHSHRFWSAPQQIPLSYDKSVGAIHC